MVYNLFLINTAASRVASSDRRLPNNLVILFMHYTEIEMAKSMSTPTKISGRNPVCRLCVGSHESRYMLRIFSKAGLSKDLFSKVYKTWGVKISEDDMRSAVLWRSGVTIVDKMDQFIRRAQSVDNSTSTLFNKNIDYNILACKIASANLGGPVERKIKWKERKGKEGKYFKLQ